LIGKKFSVTGCILVELSYHRSGSNVGVAQVSFNLVDNEEAARRAAQPRTEDTEAIYRGQIEAIERSQMKIEFNMDGTVLRANDNYPRAFGYTNAEIDRKEECEAHLKAVLNSVADGIITMDATGKIVSFNPAATKMFEYEAEEMAGKNIRMLIPETITDPDDGYLAFHQSTHNSSAIEVGRELEGFANSGRVFPVELTVTETSLQGQRFLVGLIRDITERKLAERALQNQANLLELFHDGIIVRELDGQIRFWNRGAEEIYGYSKQQADGRISYDFLGTVFPKPLTEIEAELSLNGRWEGELGHTTQDGRHIVVDSRWVLQKVNHGTGYRVLEVDRDITQRKRAEDESAHKMQALMRSNQELDAFAYAASHDLKAPLRVIHNASTWIEEDLAGKLTAETRENMNLLRSRVRRMDRLLDDLLEYSRIGRETDDRHAEAISGAALMENIRGLISPPEGFVVNSCATLAGIEVFRMPLQQILINLISNAIKHHDKETGLIEVSVEDLGSMFRFRVKDDGPGIQVRYHEQIFKMFQTLKPRDQVEGSGMGLAMVRKHVDIAGGEFELESAVGQGSTFSFTWPKDNGSTNAAEHKLTRSGETS
jgi:PAS domain S-box-containing protein